MPVVEHLLAVSWGLQGVIIFCLLNLDLVQAVNTGMGSRGGGVILSTTKILK